MSNKNAIEYCQVDDYLIPNLILPPEETSVTLSKWGMMHKDYLLKHKKAFFTTLLTQGKLYQHCAEVENQTRDMFDIKDDKSKKKNGREDESNSISNQKQIMLDYCKKHGYKNTMFFIDDGISGTSFDRSGFNQMQQMVEEGKICRIIVKDLSRFGREQVEAGRLTQIVYPVPWCNFHFHSGKCKQLCR